MVSEREAFRAARCFLEQFNEREHSRQLVGHQRRDPASTTSKALDHDRYEPKGMNAMRHLIWLLGIVAAVTVTACSSNEATAPSTTVTDTGDEARGELIALTYNVAGLPDALSGSNPEANTELIGPLLNDYDLVLLQESWKTPDPNPTAPSRVYHEILEAASEHAYKSEPAEQPLGTDPDRPTALLADGLNRFSTLPFGPLERQRWAECFGDATTGAADCLSLKGFTVATTTLADRVAVDVYNLHGEAGSTETDQRLQREDFEQLAAYIADHSQGRAIILGGDTNLHTDHEPEDPQDIQDSDIWAEFLQTTGLTDACDAVGCDDPGRIDKFAFRGSDDVELTALSWMFETDTFQRDDGEPLSDHDPLAVRFAWTAT
jgi:hypothetical protein